MRWFASVLLCAAACASNERQPKDPAPAGAIVKRDAPPAIVDRDRPIEVIHLDVDVETRTATARLELTPSASDGGLTVEVGNLDIETVFDEVGTLRFVHRDDRLDVGVPKGVASVTIRYRFGIELQFDGAMPSGSTFTWPSYCGNLFPCRSRTKHGSRYTLALRGIKKGETAVYPKTIPAAAPAYMVAWAVGNYQYKKLGETSAGTEIGIYSVGTFTGNFAPKQVVDAIDFFEKTLGPYPFGDKMGAVAVDWTGTSYEMVDHHPYWHIISGAAVIARNHIHQAAHGWFGNGVRLKCWEDFVLSEGMAMYLTPRAEEAAGANAASTWNEYRNYLDQSVARPDGCGEFDVQKDGLTSNAPYYKGAFFFRALEKKLGRVKFDNALSSFYRENVGQARGIADFLDHIEKTTGYDAGPCADEWLRETHVPADETCP